MHRCDLCGGESCLFMYEVRRRAAGSIKVCTWCVALLGRARHAEECGADDHVGPGGTQ